MANSWNDEQTLRNRILFLGDDDTWDLNSILEQANRRVKTVFGSKVQETLRKVYENQRIFYTKFPNIHCLKTVYLNDKVVDNENYETLDTETSDNDFYIEFTETYADANLNRPFNLVIEYVPTVFKDLELQFAIEEILTWTSVQSNDENENTRLTNAKSRSNKLIKEIKNLMPIVNRNMGNSLKSNARQWGKFNLINRT